MQKARIRTGWRNKTRSIGVEEFANALSAICWRISLNAAKNLHEQDFVYDNDQQRLGVIRHYLYFFAHMTDRLMYDSLDDDQRRRLLTALCIDCQRHYQQNAIEILGFSPDRSVYIDDLNAAMTALSAFRFINRVPSYEMYRFLGANIQQLMGQTQINKWIIDQIMDVDGPNAYDLFYQSFAKLKRSSGY